jgi:hypothetical protein
MALLLGAAMTPATSPAFAGAPGEPLIVTEVPDPDPNFVPPREPKRKARPARARKTAKPTMNQVMEDLGRLTGQLELLGQQVRQARRGAQTDPCATLEDHSGAEQRCGQ